MKRRTQIAAAGTTAVVALGFGTGAVVAGGNGGHDDGEGSPITGTARAQAEEAALDAVGEGTVTGTEVDDEQGKYEVEITRDDGTQVDVHLDENLTVIDQESEGAEESEGSNEGDEGQEGDEGSEGDDADQNHGPDADPSEPGHQDAVGDDPEE